MTSGRCVLCNYIDVIQVFTIYVFVLVTLERAHVTYTYLSFSLLCDV